MEKPSILFIVEGEKLEYRLIRAMTDAYQVSCRISCVRTNIHNLYARLKKDNFFTEVQAVLMEINQETIHGLQGHRDNRSAKRIAELERDIVILRERHAYVYLVFDAEIQHGLNLASHTEEERQQVIERNARELSEMADFFNNETENGKLYINYPMMESFKDCDDFFDDGYRDRAAALGELCHRPGYKALIQARKLANIRPDTISREQYSQLALMNVYKLSWLFLAIWDKLSYEDYRRYSQQLEILAKMGEELATRMRMPVLNTLLFFILDYFGKSEYQRIVCRCCD